MLNMKLTHCGLFANVLGAIYIGRQKYNIKCKQSETYQGMKFLFTEEAELSLFCLLVIASDHSLVYHRL